MQSTPYIYPSSFADLAAKTPYDTYAPAARCKALIYAAFALYINWHGRSQWQVAQRFQGLLEPA